ANAAIKELKSTALEADTKLNSRLEEAERFGLELANHVSAGTALVDRIAKITAAARMAQPMEPVGGTEKAQSALQQLAMRARTRRVVIFAAAALLRSRGFGLVPGGGYVLTGATSVLAAGGGEAPAADADGGAPTLALPVEPTMQDTSPVLEDQAPTLGARPEA